MRGRSARFRPLLTALALVLAPGLCFSETRVDKTGWYRLEGTLETHLETAHLRDSPVVPDPEKRDTWFSRGYGEALLQHHFGFGTSTALIDHGILIFPGSSGNGGGAIGPGTGGSGAREVAEVELFLEVYQAQLTILPLPWMQVVAGRQFHWDGEGVYRTSPAGLFFSVTDGLHPRAALAVAQPGFDGVRLEIDLDRSLGLAGAVALQDTLSAGSTPDIPLQGARYALHGWVEGNSDLRLGLAWVGQNETMQRIGAFGVLAPGPFRIGLEGAIEMFDPRERVVQSSALFGIRSEYSHSTARNHRVSLFAEYHHNGLAGIYPEDRTRVPVTSDGAGGFPRPGRHYAQYGFSLGREKRWSSTNTFFTNLSDESTLVEHELSLLIFDPARFSLGILWISGDAKSEFGVIQEDFILRLSAGFRL